MKRLVMTCRNIVHGRQAGRLLHFLVSSVAWRWKFIHIVTSFETINNMHMTMISCDSSKIKSIYLCYHRASRQGAYVRERERKLQLDNATGSIHLKDGKTDCKLRINWLVSNWIECNLHTARTHTHRFPSSSIWIYSQLKKQLQHFIHTNNVHKVSIGS